MRNQILLISLIFLFVINTANCQRSGNVRRQNLDFGFSFNVAGFGPDFSAPKSDFISKYNFAGSVRALAFKRDSPHFLSLEFFVSGRRLDWEQLESTFNENQHTPEDLMRLTQDELGFSQKHSCIREQKP